MPDSISSLAYLNEDDKAFGLAGMMIALAELRAIDRVAFVSLENDGPMVDFSHEYYFIGSPSISPKSTWDNLVENFHLTTTMVVANLLARSLVRMKQEAPQSLIDEIYREVEAEGRESCDLEEDEIQRLFQNALVRSSRIFHNPRLQPAVAELAHIISRKRSLSGREVIDELHFLQLL